MRQNLLMDSMLTVSMGGKKKDDWVFITTPQPTAFPDLKKKVLVSSLFQETPTSCSAGVTFKSIKISVVLVCFWFGVAVLNTMSKESCRERHFLAYRLQSSLRKVRAGSIRQGYLLACKFPSLDSPGLSA